MNFKALLCQMNVKYKKLNTIEELKAACISKDGKQIEVVILLGGGLLRSTKTIFFNEKKNTFSVENYIDDTFQGNLTEDQLRYQTNLVTAMENGSLFCNIY